jgi:ATP-dependent Lon protease
MGYDLSKVMFIATSNMSSIQPALRDRMEIIKCLGIYRKGSESASAFAKTIKRTWFDFKDLTLEKNNWKKMWKDIPVSLVFVD